jgi:hypothetical protein
VVDRVSEIVHPVIIGGFRGRAITAADFAPKEVTEACLNFASRSG